MRPIRSARQIHMVAVFQLLTFGEHAIGLVALKNQLFSLTRLWLRVVGPLH